MKKLFILTIFTTFIILGLNAQIINIPADYPTIQQGIDASSDGDTVLVQPGTYFENLLIDSASNNIVLGSLYLTTNNPTYIDATILDGNQYGLPCIRVNSTGVLPSEIVGFTLQNAYTGSDEFGSAINIEGSAVVLRNLIMKNNNSQTGAGVIKVYYSNAIIRDVEILDNINNGACLTNFASDSWIYNLSIHDNSCTRVVSSWHGESRLEFINSKIYNNNASSCGLYTTSPYTFIINSTISNNATPYGLFVSTVGDPKVINTIISGHQENNIYIEGGVAYINYCAIEGGYDNCHFPYPAALQWGEHNISGSPSFIDEINGDLHLTNCDQGIGKGIDYEVLAEDTLVAPNYDCDNSIRPQPVGSNPDIGAYENTLGIPLIPPSITLQPIGTEICENGSYTLSIEADGSPVLYYQWQMDNVDLDGETNSYLILNNLTQANEGNYRCLVSNSCETISSNNVFINVLASPSVTQQPTDKYVYVGNGISFELAVTGDEPLNYQWYGPSGILTGDTLDYLLLTNINYSDTGYYYCSITNTCGTENTNNALLTVYDQLTVDAGNDLSIPIGTDTILNGSFQGGSPSIGYYWSPDSLLVNPNVLNPQTLNLFAAQTFTLNVFDSIVDYQASDNMLITVVENDTLNYNTFESDTMYEYNVTRSNCGYVAGNNCDNDLIKAQYFYDDVKLFEINEILLHFGKATKTSEEEIPIKIGIWDNTGDDNNPGTILTSAHIPLSDIVEDIKNERLSSIVFTEPIKVSNGFYIGVFLPETEGDTVVLFTNKDGESQPNLSWSQKNGYEWSSYSQDPRWYLNVSNAIFPIVKQINLSINNIIASENEYLVYPNPASNRVIIEAKKKTSGDAELMLFDMQGRVLEQKKFTISTNLHLQNLNPGIYLLSIIKSNGNEVHKIIIQ